MSQLTESIASNSRLNHQNSVDYKSNTTAGPQFNVQVPHTFTFPPLGGTSSNPKASSLVSGMSDGSFLSTSTKLPSPWTSSFASGGGATSSELLLNPIGSPSWTTGVLSPFKATSSQQPIANYSTTPDPAVASEVNGSINNTSTSSFGSHISSEDTSSSSLPPSPDLIYVGEHSGPGTSSSSDLLSLDTIDDIPKPTLDDVHIPSFTLPVTSAISRSSIFASSHSNPTSTELSPRLEEPRLPPSLSQSSLTLPSDPTVGTAIQSDKSI